MSIEALKKLSHQYMRGEISQAEYRQRRKEVIDQVTGHVDIQSSDSANPSSSMSSSSSPLLKASIISVLVVVGLLVLYSAM